MANEISDFLNYLSIEKGLAKNTVKSYAADLAIYADFDPDFKISQDQLNNFLAQERKLGKAEASIAREIVTLRNFAAFIAKEIGRAHV